MPGIGKCRDCGDEIYWFKTPSGATHPPLVPGTGTAIIVIDNVVHSGRPWNRHACDPERIAARERNELARQQSIEDQARVRREAQEAQSERRLRFLHEAAIYDNVQEAREVFGKELYRRAMQHYCDKCGAVPKEPCENLSFASRGVVRYTKSPHQERVDCIPEAQRPFWISTTEFVAPKEE